MRHQLAVLQRRQPRRLDLDWADRALLATMLGVIPKARRHGLRAPRVCCRSSPKRAFRNVVQQPADPREHVSVRAANRYPRAGGDCDTGPTCAAVPHTFRLTAGILEHDDRWTSVVALGGAAPTPAGTMVEDDGAGRPGLGDAYRWCRRTTRSSATMVIRSPSTSYSTLKGDAQPAVGDTHELFRRQPLSRGGGSAPAGRQDSTNSREAVAPWGPSLALRLRSGTGTARWSSTWHRASGTGVGPDDPAVQLVHVEPARHRRAGRRAQGRLYLRARGARPRIAMIDPRDRRRRRGRAIQPR